MTKPANCIFAVHFDDENDPRYLAICKLLVAPEMWINNNLVTALHCKSVDEMKEILGAADD